MHEELGKVLSGHTSCPAAPLLRCSQEPYCAVPGDDCRVSCWQCGRTTSEYAHELTGPLMELPEPILKVVIELISWDHKSQEEAVGPYRVYRVGQKGLFQDPPTEHDNQRAAFAVAQGHADTLLSEAERMTILFSLSTKLRHDRIKLTYLPSDIDTMDATPVEWDGTEVATILSSPRVSKARAKAVRGLMRLGFKLVVADLDSMMPRILLKNTTNASGIDGVTAEFTWLSD